MKKLPIGIQSIEKILAPGNYIYIDKTPLALQLIDGDAPHYFLSRPRRFGK
ncbi:MAG: AAA family ATPase, partial [Bacteroidota bacterium]